MYTPSYHKEEDLFKIASYMRKYPFATMVTNGPDHPIATHLPIIVNFDEKNKSLSIKSHLAKANGHWKLAQNNESLLIFSEPHAYIPSSIHKDTHTVPTWNYIAVHVYGKAKLLALPEEIMDLMKASIDRFGTKADYKEWQNLDRKKLENLIKRVVAFELEITDIQARFKLSQEESKEDQKRIKKYLDNSENTQHRDLSNFFKP